MATVLNRTLYDRLKAKFVSVRLSNVGQAMIAEDGDDVFAEYGEEPKPHLEISQPGEYYLVCCPFCDDTRHRLYVSHRFGTKSDAGRVLDFLAVCYNEGCLRKEENREEFRDYFKVLDGELERAKIGKGSTVPAEMRTVDWPGHCKRLDQLKEGHKARRYVESRKFDPDRLGKVYEVSYCDDSFYPLARNRLVVPVYWEGRLVGWQTRFVGELDWKNPAKKEKLPPKYWTMPGMPRGTILPNLHNARLFGTGVLVEGWFDVFSFGPMAMPVLGNGVTHIQQRLFSHVFNKQGHSGVLLLDPEEFNSMTTQRAIRVLRTKFGGGTFAAVKLPKGTDPGKLNRQFLRDYVREEAADQGVKVSWERIE
jgi:hypothetical protein